MDLQRLSALEELYDRNPAYASLYAKACLLCSDPVEEAALVESLAGFDAGFGRLQDVPSVIGTLVSRGALVCERYVDGVLYEGDMRQLQADESVPEDAKIECFYRASEEGTAAASAHSPEGLIDQLFSAHPENAEGFRGVLEACRHAGKSTRELQDALREGGLLAVDPETGLETLHASYFTTALERAGALEWIDKKWRTTAEGERALGGAVV